MNLILALLVGCAVTALVSAGVSWNWKDELAEATCLGLDNSGKGWTFAVRRPCVSGSTLNCHTVCANVKYQDTQTSPYP